VQFDLRWGHVPCARRVLLPVSLRLAAMG